MKIHFCDLCNESVPQTDLDEGRAFLRKGRVICLTCDKSMSHPEEGGGPGSATTPPDGASPAGPFGGGPASSDALQGGASGAPTAPLQPTGTWGSAPHQPLHTQRARGGGPGLGLAFLAILLIGAVGFWLHDRIEKLDRLVAADAQKTLQEQRLSERRTEQGLQRLGDGFFVFRRDPGEYGNVRRDLW